MTKSAQKPLLSVEITKECPLQCPGCYAYEPEHLGNTPLRQLVDYRGAQLVDGVLALVRRYRPLHISIVGGEPLVRYRELIDLLPKLERMGIEVQLVTSAVRPIPAEWASLRCLHLVVSVDGLAPEHDRRRAPATYSRILQNISGHRVIVHCTITRQQVLLPGYLAEFASFWSERSEARKIWFSLFTPQVGNDSAERLTNDNRARALAELATFPQRFPKVHLSQQVLDGYRRPPASPAEHAVPLGRPRDAHYAMPVRGPAGLLRMRLPGFRGYDRHRPLQAGGDRAGCGSLLDLAQAR